jgi:pimeloyl-ACP methyl ester carboxylesterase
MLQSKPRVMTFRLVACVCLGCVCPGIVTTIGQELRRSGFLGVQVVPIPDATRIAGDLPGGVGVLVQTLIEGGSAKAAGLQPNDVVTQVGDHTVVGVADFVQVVKRLRAGDVVKLTIRRDGHPLTVQVPIRPRPFEAAADVDVRYDAITVDGTLRRTIVTAPRGRARHPAVLYLNGIGCFSQESLDLSSHDAKLLYGLARAGYVTMRVEKGGMGDSEGPPCDSSEADFDAETRGYVAGLKALKEASFVDPDNVFLVGVSIGGVEAPLVAGREHVRGIVVVNTVAKPFFEYLLDTRRRQMGLRHVPPDEIDRRMRLDELCNHRLLIERQTPEAVLDAAPGCADHIEYPAPFTYMQEWAALNPADAWKQVDVPVLIVYGTSDYVSTIADDPLLADLVNTFHPASATLKPISGMDHYMGQAPSMQASSAEPNAPRDFAPAVLAEISAWLQAMTKKAAPEVQRGVGQDAVRDLFVAPAASRQFTGSRGGRLVA